MPYLTRQSSLQTPAAISAESKPDRTKKPE
jgi:hypothetical protein